MEGILSAKSTHVQWIFIGFSGYLAQAIALCLVIHELHPMLVSGEDFRDVTERWMYAHSNGIICLISDAVIYGFPPVPSCLCFVPFPCCPSPFPRVNFLFFPPLYILSRTQPAQRRPEPTPSSSFLTPLLPPPSPPSPRPTFPLTPLQPTPPSPRIGGLCCSAVKGIGPVLVLLLSSFLLIPPAFLLQTSHISIIFTAFHAFLQVSSRYPSPSLPLPVSLKCSRLFWRPLPKSLDPIP